MFHTVRIHHQTYITCRYLCHGDYTGSSIEAANIRYLEELKFLNPVPRTSSDPRFEKYWHPTDISEQRLIRFKKGSAAVPDIEAIRKPLFKTYLDPCTFQVWMAEGLAAKYRIASRLEQYPILCEDLVTEVEMAWEAEDFSLWIDGDIGRLLEDGMEGVNPALAKVWANLSEDARFALYHTTKESMGIDYLASPGGERGLSTGLSCLIPRIATSLSQHTLNTTSQKSDFRQ
ncbi:hypothetical protein SCOR_02420 [Sulfidibacter corallicola]|uniref:Uncharacterized protein n=1 Tax=Sulfidibacter corallicola TaxID=2818388 RepID=A0A8A4TIF5_SULCO|nr:hypothetical protein [Sulfidibacter corallicola]QTD48621.1 hypothetical protein J3U87_23825 [Sulfidibacter corallicola]